MAKISVTTKNITVEADSQKEIFETLASYQEVFGTTTCKGCGSDNLKYVVRISKNEKSSRTYKYFEIRCADCYAKLIFGQHENGQTLYPKEWVRWDKAEGKEIAIES